MINIEKNKSYSFNLMPNLHDLQQIYVSLEYTHKEKPNSLVKRYFMYVLKDGKIDVLNANNQIIKLISNTISGHFTNTNKDFTCEYNIDEYLMNDEGDIIFDDYRLEEDREGLIEDGYKSYTDIVSVKPKNPFDINSGTKLEFDTLDSHGFLQYVDLRFIEGEPIYKDGDDKSAIINLYDGTNTLDIEIENYKKDLSNRFPVLFGSVAKKAVYDNYKKQTV